MRTPKGEGSIFRTDKGWRGYVTVNGKRKYFTAPSKALAAAKRRELIQQREAGEVHTGKVHTIESWLEHWLTLTEEQHRASTHAGYRGYVRNYITPAIGNVRLDKLTLGRLEDFYSDLAARGLSGSTRHQVHSILRVALKHAVWRGHVGRNVATLIQPPSPSKRHMETFSDADRDAIYQALVNHRYEARWLLGLDLGLRPGEAMAPEWHHLNVDRQELRIEQQILQIRGQGATLVPYTKTESGARTLHLPDYIMEALQRTRERQLAEMAALGDEWESWEPDGQPHAFIFTQPTGQPLRPGLDFTIWRKLLAAAGLPATRRYTARHTAASNLLANPLIDPQSAADALGHANAAFTAAVYGHAIEERKRQLAAALQARHELDKVHNRVHHDKSD